MFSLEDKLRPPLIANAWRRDLMGLAVLAVLAFVLVPSLGIDFSGSQPRSADTRTPDADRPRDADDGLVVNNFLDVTCPMLSPWLLPAMGFLLALRRGAIDLSVWLSMAAGGLVSAWLIRSGVGTAAALGAGVLAGAAIGAINGLLVALAKQPSVAVTVVVALMGIWVPSTVVERREVWVEQFAFDAWIIEGFPLFVTPMLLVAGIFVGVMLLLTATEIARGHGVRFGGRLAMFAALCASGALSAAGGAVWLIDHGCAPVPTRPVGDLRIVAAAILAGALFFAGRGRTLLAAAALPVAMLLTYTWRQKVWNYQISGYAIQMVLLAAMTLVVHAAMARTLAAGRKMPRLLAIVSAVLVVFGIIATAHNANASRSHGTLILGLAVWGAGTALLVVSRMLERRVPPR